MKIYGMKVNHMTKPLGFRMQRVVFSWKVCEAKGRKQTEARIVVALDEKMERIVFDSGFSQEIDSLGCKAEFDLEPYTRYYWTVTVRTDAGEEETGEMQWFETAKREEEWVGKWITCDNGEKRHPFFEKEIQPSKAVKQARLYICGLGLYEVFCDGRRIGREYMTPYCNDYNGWVQYQTFDVTELFAKEMGEKKLSILLGNGWYKARFGFAALEDKGFYGNEWKMIAELRFLYEDGTVETVGTDDTWSVRRSKITFSNLYDGEHQDATLPELPIEKAEYTLAPKGNLTERMSLPVTIHEIFEPAELIHTPAGEEVFDMGQEFTGLFSLKVDEPAGTKIHIQTGEILQEGNFYNENLRSAKSEYIYISDGNPAEIIPHFTFYGYRYVKIQGVANLKKEDFKGMALYSDIDFVGEMKTGHDLVNRLISNVRWGQKSNFLDVPTDCPQRDERMGWTGDAQVFSPTAMYLSDSYAFYAKYLYDMAKEQSVLSGKVPDVVPSCGVETTACVWGDAACIIPWNLYLFYGDKSILEDQFVSMKSWVDYVQSVDGENHGWRDVFHYGDWLALDHPVGGAEQVLGGTDEEFIANLYYAVSAGLVASAARVLKLEDEERKYRTLSREQFEIVKKEYYSVTGRCCIKTQTALLLTLKYHLSENEELIKKQLKKLFDESGGKLKTGFVGTPLLNNVLTENGFEKLAYELLLNEEYPGWLREVKLGATTVWERWNSLLDDGTISGISMNSMNHYAYGSILEWMFRYVAGINTIEESPGLRRMAFMPVLNWEIRKAEAAYDSPAGRYESRWELEDPSHVTLSVTVPFGCEAELKLPMARSEVYENWENPMFEDVREGMCHLTAGTYTVRYETMETLKKCYTIDTPIRELFANPKLVKKLEGMLSLVAIPEQYQCCSLREVSKKFEGRITEEQMKKIERILEEI